MTGGADAQSTPTADHPMCVRLPAYIYIHLSLSIYIYIYVCKCVCVCVCVYTYMASTGFVYVNTYPFHHTTTSI